MTNRFISLFFLIITQLFLTPYTSFSQSKDDAEINNRRNVILMIGDGMGISQIYSVMAATPDKLNITRCTNTALVITSSANDDVTDSAAAGTAIATGTKTNNGSIGVDSANKPLESMLKIAERNGLSTGLVATSDITHATPASFIASVQNRGMTDDIAKQFLDTDIDVFIGGGLNAFSKRKDSINYIDSLRAADYNIATSLEELEKYHSGKLAGLLYPEHAPKIIDGRGNMLGNATSKALELLSKNESGFFLMIEGSQIDWGGHDNDINYLQTELLDFDKAVGIAIDFAEKNPETLVIVTADHETGGLTLIESKTNKGKMNPVFSTDHHSGSPVGLFAFGKEAEKFNGIIDNTDIFKLILSTYGFNK